MGRGTQVNRDDLEKLARSIPDDLSTIGVQWSETMAFQAMPSLFRPSAKATEAMAELGMQEYTPMNTNEWASMEADSGAVDQGEQTVPHQYTQQITDCWKLMAHYRKMWLDNLRGSRAR